MGDGPREYAVESAVPYRSHFILKLKGVDTLDQAERLAGREILVAEDEVPPLE
ncbi:MAG: 16S rRNA processing protein RimM, partial [Candidatus Aminicenantes bacterium]|nr:16S rRNA processing protein RimM [Candidatus Aminicenantes bacterium]